MGLMACLQARQALTWTGAADNNWHNPLNWSPVQMVPNQSVLVSFTSTYSNPCVISVDAVVEKITFVNYTGKLTNALNNRLYVGTLDLGTTGRLENYGTIECFTSLTGTVYPMGDPLKGEVLMRTEYGGSFPPDVSNMFKASDKLNFILVQSPQRPITDPNVLQYMSPGSVLSQYQYFDAAGRPIETVVKQGAPNRQDLVQLMDYDASGRQPQKYLPYAAATYTGQYQKTKYDMVGPSAFEEQLSFYKNNTDNITPMLDNRDATANNNALNAYKDLRFDPHHPTQVGELAHEGNAWKMVNGHTLKTQTYLNAASEVLWWTVDAQGNLSANATATQRNYYPPAALRLVVDTDENNNLTYSYYDAAQHLVLKRTGSAPATAPQTAYVYDDFSRLRAIITPEGYKNLPSTNYYLAYGSDYLKKYAYCYFYDEKGRAITERQPGIAEKQLVYDALDRVVLTKENLGAEPDLHLFKKYDVFGRVLYSGTYTTTTGIATLRAAVKAQTALHEKEASAVSTSNYQEGYTNSVYPVVASADVKIAYYYDDYANPTNYMTYKTLAYTQQQQICNRPRGRLTGKKVKNLTTTDFYVTRYTYNYNGQLIGKVATSAIDPSKDDAEISYLDFKGRLLQQLVYDQKDALSYGSYQFLTRNNMSYDPMGRPLRVYHRINSNPEILLASYKYNRLGQLVERNLHSENNGGSFLQSIDYRYNIRGWLASINSASLANTMTSTPVADACGNVNLAKTNDDANDLFGMELLYNEGFLYAKNNGSCDLVQAPMYDGKISGIRWRTNNPMSAFNQERAYMYLYDQQDRLGYAQSLLKPANGDWTVSPMVKEVPTYDHNGNLTSLQRTDASGTVVDQLSYVYNGNQLTRVDDAADKTKGFIDVANTADYNYDANGNLQSDNNKYLTMGYNYLGLAGYIMKALDGKPANIFTTTSAKIVIFTYDAEGRLLKREEKTVTAGQTTASAVTQYGNAGHVKMQGSEYLLHPEGRLEVLATGAFNYVYHIKDHLNHVRVTFDKKPGTTTAQLRQEENFTPFGVRHTGYTLGQGTNFIFSEKEWEGESIGMYDFGWRHYDPMLGRWHSPDKHALLYHDVSPYAFASNDPVNNMELDGRVNVSAGYSGGSNGGYYANNYCGPGQGGPASTGFTYSGYSEPQISSVSMGGNFAGNNVFASNGEAGQSSNQFTLKGQKTPQQQGQKVSYDTFKFTPQNFEEQREAEKPESLINQELVEKEEQKEEKSDDLLDIIDKALDIWDVGNTAREIAENEIVRQQIINAERIGESVNIKGLLPAIQKIGKAIGGGSAVISLFKFIEKPGVGTAGKLILDTGLLFVRVNPYVAIGIGILDATGGTDAIVNWIDGE